MIHKSSFRRDPEEFFVVSVVDAYSAYHEQNSFYDQSGKSKQRARDQSADVMIFYTLAYPGADEAHNPHCNVWSILKQI